jgi:hypothetical protein
LEVIEEELNSNSGIWGISLDEGGNDNEAKDREGHKEEETDEKETESKRIQQIQYDLFGVTASKSTNKVMIKSNLINSSLVPESLNQRRKVLLRDQQLLKDLTTTLAEKNHAKLPSFSRQAIKS